MVGERHIERQREIVAKLEKTDPQEASRARALLAQFEEIQMTWDHVTPIASGTWRYVTPKAHLVGAQLTRLV